LFHGVLGWLSCVGIGHGEGDTNPTIGSESSCYISSVSAYIFSDRSRTMILTGGTLDGVENTAAGLLQWPLCAH
jgi:hypothetical protein